MASFKLYDFTLSAGATVALLVEGEYFRIQEATGAVDVTVEGSGTLPGLLVGQGLKETPYKRLLIRDASGAANVGKILIASKEFIDNRTYGVTTISGTPSVVINNVNGSFSQNVGSIGTASAQLVAASASRRYVLIQNQSADVDLYVTLDGAAATVARGLKIPAGGSYEIANFCPTTAIYGITSSGSATCCMVWG